MYQPNIARTNIAGHCPSASECSYGLERPHWNVEDGDAGRTQFVGANTFGPEGAHMRLKSSSIQSQRDFCQLPLTASVVEFTNHQQDPRLHFQFTVTRPQNSSQPLGFAKSAD